MGCVISREPPEPQAREAGRRNASIEKQIRSDKRAAERIVRVLLLGAGESGKSTILKQMRIIHSGGFPDAERQEGRAIIYTNLIDSFNTLFQIMVDKKLEFEHHQSEEDKKVIQTINPGALAPEMAFADSRIKTVMQSLWEDTAIKRALSYGHEYALHDNLAYYFESLDRYYQPDWIPNNQDMLHARLRTTGTTEQQFDLGYFKYLMVDVGGQRSERKKWIHCFEGVQTLLFLAALSGYDQCLVEDQTANQMREAMMLFESIVNGQWFKHKPVILFLNKVDLFNVKIAHSPVSPAFPEFSGPDRDRDAAAKFFEQKFISLSRVPNREVYTHYTNATDTTLSKRTMKSVEDMIVRKNLSAMSL